MKKVNLINNYKLRLKSYIDDINAEDLIKTYDIIKSVIEKGNSIFIIGNGGSSSISEHFMEDLLLNTKRTKTINLCSLPCITAISNDTEYKLIYVKQLEKLFSDGDLLITISCSGNSENLVEALKFVHNKGISISITGFDGGITSKLSDHSIYIKTDDKDYETTEDLHMIICHVLSTLIREDDN